MAVEDIKALLLEDYRYRATGMAESEKSGETRVNLFIGLITFCAGALGAAYAKGSLPDPGQLRGLGLATALALLAIGIVILGRMSTRNEHTDLAKRQLDLIRQTFKDHFDDRRILANYNLFPKAEGRKFGGLTDLVGTVNGTIAAGAVAFAVLVGGAPPALAAVIGVLAFFPAVGLQCAYIRRRRNGYKERHDAYFGSTHAGGVVYSDDSEPPRYLIVRPKDDRKDEWVLPKGHIERGEHPSAAALREVGEEAGVFAQIVAELPSISFPLKGCSETARIQFYLMRKIGEVTLPNKEVRGVRWASRDEAISMLSFDESKALVRRADEMIAA